jgi:hypothetical protein
MISQTIATTLATLGAFLAKPSNLAQWTVHRALFEQDGQWYEVRRHPEGHLHPVALHVERRILDPTQQLVQFAWQSGNVVQFHLQQIENNCCSVSITLPPSLAAEKSQAMSELLQIELELLQAWLEKGSTANIPIKHWIYLQNYHVKMYL